MVTILALGIALLLLASVGVLLLWAFSAGCRFLAALVADPSDTSTP